MKMKNIVLITVTAGVFGALGAKTLDTLVVQGLTINQPSIVRNTIPLRQGKEITTSDIQESIRKLYNLGIFRSADITVLNETDSTVSLTVTVEEFPLLESIEYSGVKKLKDKEVEEKITIKRGQAVTDQDLFKSERAIYDLYTEKGYLLAEIKGEKINTKIPGNVIVKFTVKEGSKVSVKKISFKGNKDFKSAKLLSKFKTKEDRWWRGGEFDKSQYKANLDTLILFYNDQGYLDATITSDSVWYSDSKKDIFIEVTIDEGRKYLAGDFFFTGNRILDGDSLKTKIALKSGKPFQKARFDMSKYFIENAYREEGYLWVNVEDRKTFRGDTIDVVFNITEGRPAIVRKIDIRGNGKTMEKVVRREIDLIPGEKYKQSLMARSQQKIYALNYFSNVAPDLSPNEDGTIDLVFDVAEKDNIGQLSIGAAFSQIDGFVGTFSTAVPNFRGAGQELKVNLEYGVNRTNVTLGFTEPWAFDMPLLLAGQIFYDKNNVRYDTTISQGFAVTVGRPKLKWPDDHFTIKGTYQLSHEQSSGDSVHYSGLSLREDGWLSRLSGVITRYDFDVPTFPNSGSRLTISPMIAGLGGDYRYLKGTAQYEQYFQLPHKLVLGYKTKFGVIAGLGDNIIISRYDLFRLGGVYGDGDLRGYPEYSFGGYQRPSEGISMFTSNLELRYPILPQQLYVGVFGDIGNTWNNLGDVNFSDLYKGVGFGLRINIPMLGIMGFDFAWGLDPIAGDLFHAKPNGFEFHFLMNRGF